MVMKHRNMSKYRFTITLCSRQGIKLLEPVSKEEKLMLQKSSSVPPERQKGSSQSSQSKFSCFSSITWPIRVDRIIKNDTLQSNMSQTEGCDIGRVLPLIFKSKYALS